MLDHSSHVVEVTFVKFVVNCLVYGKSLWKVTHSVEQRVQIIKFYYQNQCSVQETFRVLRNFYLRHNRLAESTIRRLMAKFESTDSINNQSTSVRRNARSVENIAAVRESVRENPVNFSSFTRTWPFCDFNLANFASGLGSAL